MTTANISLGVKSDQAGTKLDELLAKIKTVKTELEALNRLVPEDKLTQQLRAQVAGADEVGSALGRLGNQVKQLSTEQSQAAKTLATEVEQAAQRATKAAETSAGKVKASYKEALSGGFSISFRVDEAAARAGGQRANAIVQDMLRAELDRRAEGVKTGQVMVKAELDRAAEGRKTGQQMVYAEIQRREEGKKTALQQLIAETDRREQGKRTGQEMLKAELDRQAQGKATGQVMLKAELDRAAQGRATGQEMLRWELVRREEGKQTAVQQLIAETNRREEGKRTGQEMLRAEMARRQQMADAAKDAKFLLENDEKRLKIIKEAFSYSQQPGITPGMVTAKVGPQAAALANQSGIALVENRVLQQQEQMRNNAQAMLIAETNRAEQLAVAERNAKFLLATEERQLKVVREAYEYSRQQGVTPGRVEVKYGSAVASQATAPGVAALESRVTLAQQQVRQAAQDILKAETERNEQLRIAAANTNFLKESGRTQVQQLERQLQILKEAQTYSQQPGVTPGHVEVKYGSIPAGAANPAGIQQYEKALDAAKQQAAATAQFQAQLTGSINTTATAAQRAAEAHKQHTAAMHDAHSAARGLAGGLDMMWLSYGAVLPLIAGAAIATSMKQAVTGFAEVQMQMTMVKALSEDTTHTVAQLSSEMHGVSLALGISPEVASKGLRALTQAGLDASQALATLSPTFKLATVGELGLEQAALSATGVMNSFGKSFGEIEHIGDVMAKAGAVSAASVSSITESMKYASASASTYGVSLEKLATIITLLGKRGITGSTAGTASNNLITETFAPSSEKAKKALKELGVSAYDSLTGLRRDIVEVLFDIKEKIKNYTPESQGLLLEAIYGKKGDKAFNAVIQNSKEKVGEIFGQVSNSDGFVSDVFSKRLQTVSGQFDILKSTIGNAFAQIGETSEGPVLAMMTRLRQAFASEDLQSSIRGLTQTIAKLIDLTTSWTGGGLLLLWAGLRVGPLVIAGITSALGALEAALVGIQTVMSAGLLASLGRLIAGFSLTNPLVATAVGVTTLLAGAYFTLREAKQSVLDKHAAEMSNMNEIIGKNEEELKQLREKLVLKRMGTKDDELEAEMRMRKMVTNRQELAMELGKAQDAKGGDPQTVFLKNRIPLLQKAISDQDRLIDKERAQGDERKQIYADLKAIRDKEAKEEQDRINAELMKGKKVFDPKTDKAAAKDIYNAEQKELDGQLEKLKDIAKYQKEMRESAHKRSEIGDIQLINQNLEAGIKIRAQELEVFKQKEALAARTENRRTDVASIQNKQDKLGREDALAIQQAEDAKRDYIKKIDDEILKTDVQHYRDRGQLQKAFLAEFDAANKDEIARMVKDLEDPKVEEALKAAMRRRMDFLDASRSSGSTNALFNEKKSQFDQLKSEMDEKLSAADAKGSSKSGVGGALLGIQMAEAIRQEALPALKQLQEELKQIAADSDNPALKRAVANIGKEMNKGANQVADAWRNAASTIAKELEKAFGRGGKAIGGMLVAATNYAQAQKKIDDELARKKEDKKTSPEELIKAEDKARKESAELQIGAYADMAGAASQFFNTNTKGYAVLHSVETAFRAYEMGLALANFIRKTFFSAEEAHAFAAGELEKAIAADASAASIIAAAQAEGQAAAAVGVATQAQGDPYSAWIRMAAMAATMAAIGFAVGGGGSEPPRDVAKDRQDRAGTSFQGKAYDKGDEAFAFEMVKSDAIAKSLDILKDNSNIALRLTNAMLMNLQSIKDNIGGMAAFISQASGMRGTKADSQALGLGASRSFLSFSKESRELTDTGLQAADGQTIGSILAQGFKGNTYQDVHNESSSFWGLFSDSSDQTYLGQLDNALSEKFQKTIQSLNTTVLESSKFLGANADTVKAKLQDLGVDLGKISFKGMSADDIQKELEAIFGKLGDDMAKTVMPGVAEFNRAGEDYLTTLVRVSTGVEQAQLALDQFGLKAVDFAALVNKQGDVTAEIIRQTITERETTYSRVFSGPSWFGGIGQSSLVPALTQVGKIIDQLPGDASALVSAYRDLIQIRSQMKAIGLNSDGLTMDAIKGAGGLDKLSAGMNDYMDKFFTSAQQNAAKGSQLLDQFKAMGVSVPRTKEDFVKLVDSINMTSVSGQKLYGQLMAISGEFADVADAVGYVIPDLIKLRGAITSEAPDTKPKPLVDQAKEWLDILNNMRDLRDTVSQAIYDQKKAALEAYADRELTSDQLTAQKTLQQDLADMRAAQEKDATARIADLWAALQAPGITAEQQLTLAGELKDQILNRYEVEKENTKDLLAYAKKLREYVQDLRTGDKSPLTLGGKLTEAQSQYNTTLSKANAGNATAMDALQGKADTYLQLARDYYASSDAYKAIFATVTGQLDASAAAAEGQAKPLTVEEQQVDELKKLQDFLNQTTAAANTKYDQIATTLSQQLLALQNMEAFYGVQSTVPDILKGLPAEIATALINAGVGRTDTPVKGVAAPLPASTYVPTATSVSGPTSFFGVSNFGHTDALVNGSHADGLGYVPFDGYIAELHKGERVMTAAENASYGRSGSDPAMVAEIRALRMEVAKLRAEQAQQATATIHAQYDATDRAAEKVVDGTHAATDNAHWKDRSAATLR